MVDELLFQELLAFRIVRRGIDVAVFGAVLCSGAADKVPFDPDVLAAVSEGDSHAL